jgi:hypothetical protein
MALWRRPGRRGVVVAFDFDGGTYEGHAIVQRAGDGWYVRRMITVGVTKPW